MAPKILPRTLPQIIKKINDFVLSIFDVGALDGLVIYADGIFISPTKIVLPTKSFNLIFSVTKFLLKSK